MENNTCLSCNQFIEPLKKAKAVQSIIPQLCITARHQPRAFRLLNQVLLCAGCLTQLTFIGQDICKRCGRNMKSDNHICNDCLSIGSEPLHMNRSLLVYNDWAKQMISRYKYRGDERLAEIMADLLAVAYFRHYVDTRFSLVTFVPLHESRMRERGFNQAEMLAIRLGRIVGIPVSPLLRRIKQTDKQSKQSGRQARLESMQRAFQLEQHGQAHLRDPILLVDDVFTTGSTVRSCADAIRGLIKHRESNICSLTLFR